MNGSLKDVSQGPEESPARLLDARAWHGPWCLLKIRGFQSSLEPGSLLRILIDDPQTARDLTLFLEKQGHLVLENNSGEMLVRTCAESRPSLVGPGQIEKDHPCR